MNVSNQSTPEKTAGVPVGGPSVNFGVSHFFRSVLPGVVLVFIGLGGILLAPSVGSFLYQNHYRLPEALRDEIYPDLYSLDTYRDQFQEWALWPAALTVLSGLLFLGYQWLVKSRPSAFTFDRTTLALWSAVALGFVFRVRALLEQRSLWLDETFIAANLRDRGLFELISEPLDYGQSGPPGFLILTWLSFSILGASEVALRLTPFLFGIATLVVAKSAAQHLFRQLWAKLTFVGTIAFSPVLVYYSAELKQYSIDAFAAVLAIWMLSRWSSQQKPWLFGLLGAVLVQFSLASVFTLTALGVSILVRYITQVGIARGFAQLVKKHLWVFVLWIAGGLVHGGYLLTAGTDTEAMRNWWVRVGGFPPREETVVLGNWLIDSFQKVMWLGFGHHSVASIDSSGPELLTAALLVIFSIGLLTSTVGRIFSISLTGSTLVLALFQLYPFYVGRLNLFLVPVLALIFAGLVDRNFGKRSGRLRLWPLNRLVAGVIMIPLGVSLIIFGRPEDRNDMRWLINEYEVRHQTGDILTTSDELIFGWYQYAINSNPVGYVPKQELLESPREFASDTIWVISTHYGAGPIMETFEGTHRAECSASPRHSTLRILVPVNEPALPSDFCAIRVPKM